MRQLSFDYMECRMLNCLYKSVEEKRKQSNGNIASTNHHMNTKNKTKTLQGH